MIQVSFLPTLPSLLVSRNAPFIHRDISWLQFNDRVLAEARQTSNPLLERVKFLAISSSNLDEFFTVRMASLGRSIAAQRNGSKITSDGRRLMRIRSSILEAVAKFGAKQVEAMDLVLSELDAAGIHIVRHAKPGDAAFEIGKALFEKDIFPNLGAPEPFAAGKLSTLENLQALAVFPSGMCFRISKNLPLMLWSRPQENGDVYFFFLDDLLSMHLGPAFRFDKSPGFLRLTRDGDFTVDLEDEDTASIPDVVRTGIRTRDKGRPVRLQYSNELRPELLEQCMISLRLKPDQVLPAAHSVFLHALWSVVNNTPADLVAKEKLKYAPLKSLVPVPFRSFEQCFEMLKVRDYLLHHPYDSFDSFVTWIQAACADPNVTCIEQTVYRIDAISPVVDALKAAAAAHKTVRVIIELRARFDELNNLRLADELRKAGVEVAFGFGKLKLHAKIALVTRNEPEGPRRYTHLSTGNYSAATARQYTDMAILTANPEIGEDARHFFDRVFAGQIPTSFKRLVNAPTKLHRRLLGHIEAETNAALAGQKARIVAKVNALVDQEVIVALYRASTAGVQVDLIVRGACSLIPGVKGLSENIRVISVVDRFLEHSRIYCFESSKTMYLSSADWMPRNFFSRLEIAFPVLDPKLYQFIEKVVIPAYLSDTVKGRELTPQGMWKKRGNKSGQTPIRSQFYLEQLAIQEYRGTPLGTETISETPKKEIDHHPPRTSIQA